MSDADEAVVEEATQEPKTAVASDCYLHVIKHPKCMHVTIVTPTGCGASVVLEGNLDELGKVIDAATESAGATVRVMRGELSELQKQAKAWKSQAIQSTQD